MLSVFTRRCSKVGKYVRLKCRNAPDSDSAVSLEGNSHHEVCQTNLVSTVGVTVHEGVESK